MSKVKAEIKVTTLNEILVFLYNNTFECGAHLQKNGKKGVEKYIVELAHYSQLLYQEINEPDIFVLLEQGGVNFIQAITSNLLVLCGTLEQQDLRQYAIDIAQYLLHFNLSLEKKHMLTTEGIKTINCSRELKEIYFLLGHMYLLNNKIDSAEINLADGFKRLQKRKDLPTLYLSYYSDLAIVAVKRGNLKLTKKYVALAEYYLEEASREVAGSGKTLVSTYSKIGHYYFLKNKNEEAIDWYENALQLLTRREGEFIDGKKIPPMIDKKTELQNISREIKVINAFISAAKEKLLKEKSEQIISCVESSTNYTFAFSEKKDTLSITFTQECNHFFEQLLKKKRWPFEKLNNAFVLDLFELNVNSLDRMIKGSIRLSEQKENFSKLIKESLPPKEDNKEISYREQKELKLARHLEKQAQKVEAPLAPIVEKVVTEERQNRKDVFIEWNNKEFPPHIKGDPNSPYKKMYKKNGKTTYWLISDSLKAEIPNKFMLNKIEKVAEDGKVFNNGNSENRQGFVFCEADDEMKKFGKEYDCKIKLLGKYGKFRPLGKKVADGKKIINEKSSDKEYELYYFDKMGSH